MKNITIDTCYRINGEPIYLNSGEFHYFRVPKADWKRRMDLFKATGGNCIATYVPWLIHEPEEGRYDFGDHDYTDLESFLKTAMEAGLYVIARPGPYQYSELRYHGLPGWLCENYPEVLAQKIDGSIMDHATISYLQPLFIEKTRIWMKKVCGILSNYTLSRGGPIVFTQPDNELGGMQIWTGGMDYHPDTMAFGQKDGRYHNFLKEKYADASDVNKAYGTEVDHLWEVLPAKCTQSDSLEGNRFRKDYFDFYCATLAEYLEVLMDMMEEFGIGTPFVHNSANPNMNCYFHESSKRLGKRLLIGSDHYYCLDSNWDANNPTPQYAVKVFYSNEMLRLMGAPPTIFELPGGSCSDWPPITAQDLEACYFTNVALGMKGHNYYIFTGGDNPPNAGLHGDTYDYGAAISSTGEIRPIYTAMKNFGQFMAENHWLMEAEQDSNIQLMLDWDMAKAPASEHGKSCLNVKASATWRFVLNGLLPTLFSAHLNPEFVDVDQQTLNLDKPLLVPSCESMRKSHQEKILYFIEAGGKVIFIPVVPTLDENLNPCRIVADALQASEIESLPESRLSMPRVANINKNGPVYASKTPDAGTTLGIDEFTGKPFIWKTPLAKGEAGALGFCWLHSRFEHTDMLVETLKAFGLHERIQCANPNLWCTLRSTSERSMLFILNLYTAEMETEVSCKPTWSNEWINTGTHTLPAMTVKCIEL